ncbi:type II toxin-antitoxin system VapC family toxin [candidate division KSB1 bacterium]
MILVDSSGWLEYFSDSANADFFAEPLNNLENVIVPAICIYEVFKVVLRERSENDALMAVSVMMQGKIIDVNSEIAIESAKLSHNHKLPMADSIILASAELYDAEIYTQDKDFRNFNNVHYIKKSKNKK